MVELRLQEVETYISCRQNKITQFIMTRPIMNLCLAEERRPRRRISNQWWDQEGVDVEGMQTAAWEAERT